MERKHENGEVLVTLECPGCNNKEVVGRLQPKATDTRRDGGDFQTCSFCGDEILVPKFLLKRVPSVADNAPNSAA